MRLAMWRNGAGDWERKGEEAPGWRAGDAGQRPGLAWFGRLPWPRSSLPVGWFLYPSAGAVAPPGALPCPRALVSAPLRCVLGVGPGRGLRRSAVADPSARLQGGLGPHHVGPRRSPAGASSLSLGRSERLPSARGRPAPSCGLAPSALGGTSRLRGRGPGRLASPRRETKQPPVPAPQPLPPNTVQAPPPGPCPPGAPPPQPLPAPHPGPRPRRKRK
ncbi:basic proline-rich protein-like [Manis pentadactyla]|uniref:basic proline-rich protein-like n=1 Tax=Manis pentadactyla TaxID=143292 RepID=UPI00255CAE28|nr:basic proline-rich protein-like [Manis pentadactyla]